MTQPFGLSMTQGSSMRPLLWGGKHCVVVVPLDESPRPGDVLMFRYIKEGETINVVHRLVDIRPNGVLITRGDNCAGAEVIRFEDIIGRVTEVHRMGGFRPWYVIPGKKFTVDGRSFRLYSYIWGVLWPLRKHYYRFRDRTYPLRARIRKLISKNR